ncbi:hypothetical protein B0H67DRAFT_542053 [Lasiosphaeris hirsuta]|uniref:CorA-like transporter domain-containing protein n=1 Tax=Lasiosphaeris hirsuta TaxID=260670 RepID=A0AA40AA32_9PEZI|nr:hypothetical protein B0H67DRAFT_542053 [Lasiosphaeris hirsuta]
MFKTIATNHQVDASFLDAVSTFGDQEEPKDLCLMNISSTHTLKTPQDKLVAIPELGRSGREIQVSYLLRSVETKENRDWPWQIRQAAVHHSFDVETGRSFWFTIKGNDLFSTRIKQSSSHLDIPSSASLDERENSVTYFRASLATHLVYLSWCDESWRQYINQVESGTRGILDSARKSPIDDDLKEKTGKLATYPESLRQSRSSTMRPRSRSNTDPFGPNVDVEMAIPKQSMTGGPQVLENSSSTEELIDTREVLDKFRFRDVQTLHTFSDRIRRAILTLKLNISVLHELHKFYESLGTSDIAAFQNIKAACKDDLTDFLAEVQSISKNLGTWQSQLECLASMLTEGITLYDGILQHRQLDIAQRFQETARKSADQMQIIANKTKLETASMHVITVVTLIFLPATFVAADLITQTFFQSGAIQWSDAPAEMTETYTFSGDGLKLFAWWLAPVTVMTLGVWLTVYMTMRRRLRREINNVLPE